MPRAPHISLDEGCDAVAEETSLMTAETELRTEWLRPWIRETEETGRLELSLPPASEPELPRLPAGRRRSPLTVALCGLGLFALGVAAIDVAEFLGRAFAHGARFRHRSNGDRSRSAPVVRSTGCSASCAGCCACVRPNACAG